MWHRWLHLFEWWSVSVKWYSLQWGTWLRGWQWWRWDNVWYDSHFLLSIEPVQMKWLTLSWQVVGKRSSMQMGPYRQLIFRTFIHLNWSAHTSYRKPQGPTSNLSFFSFTSTVMVSCAMVTFWRLEMANCRIRHCLEDSAVTSLMPQQTCCQEATIYGWSKFWFFDSKCKCFCMFLSHLTDLQQMKQCNILALS